MIEQLDDEKSRINDPQWIFLGEYALCELMNGSGTRYSLIQQSLAHTVSELGLPLERLEDIETTLLGFINQSTPHFSHEIDDSPVYIRLFCQKKALENINPIKKESRFVEQQGLEARQIIQSSDEKSKGGWGYFLVERGRGLQPGCGEKPYFIDLYLYREG